MAAEGREHAVAVAESESERKLDCEESQPFTSPTACVYTLPAMGAATWPVLVQGAELAPNSDKQAIDVAAEGQKQAVAIADSESKVDREEWWRARRRPCSRCGLVHSDYMVSARIYDFERYDCEVLFPNIDDLKMDGDTVLLPMHLIGHLIGNVEDSDEVRFVDDSLADEYEVPDSQNEQQ